MFIEELAGPKFLFIDDVESDVAPIMEKLRKKDLSKLFIDARPEVPKPEEPIKSVELVFLDLYFTTKTMAQFDAELCADIIQKTVPEGKQYFLVIFSKDTDQANDVLEILQLINLTPVKTIIKQKTNYDFLNDSEVDRFIADVDEEFDSIQHLEEFYGEVVRIGGDEVIIDCLISESEKIFQIRHFDPFPLSNMNLGVGSYVLIRTVIKLGSIIFEFHNAGSDISHLFSKDKLFTNIDETELHK